MDLKHLECFVRVAEFGSFTRAAAVLNLSQSAVSRQVRQLEIELEEHLLLRNGRSVQLTASGERLLNHGKGILRQVQVARGSELSVQLALIFNDQASFKQV